MNHSEVLPVCQAHERMQILRKAKDEERLPNRIVERTEGESAFQSQERDQMMQCIKIDTLQVFSRTGAYWYRDNLEQRHTRTETHWNRGTLEQRHTGTEAH